jgi:hypothetical protein
MIRPQHWGHVGRNHQWTSWGATTPEQKAQGRMSVKPGAEPIGSRWKFRNLLIGVGDVIGVVVLIGVIAVALHGIPLNLDFLF